MGFDVLTTNTSPLDPVAILNRFKKRLEAIGRNLRLNEIRLLTIKNNVNTFHGNMRYKVDTTPPRNRTQNISLCT